MCSERGEVMLEDDSLEACFRVSLIHLKEAAPEGLGRVECWLVAAVRVVDGCWVDDRKSIPLVGYVVNAPVELGRIEAALPKDEGEVVRHLVSGLAVHQLALLPWCKREHLLRVCGAVGGPEEGVDDGRRLESSADHEEESDDVPNLVVEL